MSARTRRRASPADRVTLPCPWRWAALGVLFGGVAAGLALAARDPRAAALMSSRTGLPDPTTIAAILDVLAALALVMALSVWRRHLYDRLARRPGPIVITSFQGDPAVVGVPTEEVLADFREALTAMSLSAPEPMPHEPSSDGVLDDARTSFADSKNAVAAAVVMLVSLLRVRHAYRVSVQLRAGADQGACGISVHISRMPSDRGDVRTVWADDWRRAAELAAHSVGAYVIPRSRLSRRAPWTAWHGLEMPLELFDHSQRANEHLRRREYEAALDELHRALEHDPLNPYLRIELAQALEQLGLLLDATAVYADTVAVESWYDRRVWRRLRTLLGDDTSGPPPGRWSRSPHGADALLIARYRLVSRLAAAEQLTRQWREDDRPGNEARAAQQDALRARIRVWLRSYTIRYLLDEEDGRDEESPRDSLCRLEAEGPLRLRHLLQFVALVETDALVDDYRWSQGRRRPGMAVTQTSLNLMRIWARLYVDDALADLGRHPERWPKTPERLDLEIARYLLLKPAAARSWREYYNAACVVAVALRGWRPDGGPDHIRNRRKLALQAVRHLERAMNSTDSGYVGRYAQWLSTGDPDLNPLRAAPEFRDFLSRYLPDTRIRVVRPEDRLLPLVMSHHVLRVLASFGRQRLEFWSRAVRVGRPRDAERDEDTALQLAAEYARDHRDWPTRMRLVALGRELAARHELDPGCSALPHFQDDPAVRARVDGLAADALHDPEAVLAAPVLAVRDAAWTAITDHLCSPTHLRTTDPAAAAVFWAHLVTLVDAAIDGRQPTRATV